MKTRGLLVVLVVLLAAVAVAAGRPSAGSLEYRFIQTGSTNAGDEKNGYLEGAEEICARMSAKGWDLVSSTALVELNGPVLVLGFARPRD